MDGSNYGFGQNKFGLPTNNMQNVPPPLPPSGVVNNGGSYFNNTSGSVDTGGAGSNNSGSTPPFTIGDTGANQSGGYGWQFGDGTWNGVSDSGANQSGGYGPNAGAFPNVGFNTSYIGDGGANQSGGYGPNAGASFGGGSGNGSNVPMSFADGGVVPDQSQAPDLGSAASLAKQVLAMGRQRNGLPPTLMGDQNSYNGDADGLQTPDANGDNDGTVDPTAFLSQGYADGGDVTEGGDMSDPSAGGMPEAPDAQPSQDPGQAGQAGMAGPVAAKMVGYLGGAEAVTPEIAQAMQQRVDPTGRMDPNSKTLLSIASAPQGVQWGMMQHYRQKYDATKAFALAAGEGTQGKPPDINASTQAATQAHQNLPDGNNVVFSPHPQGVAVHVQPLTSSKTKGYADGGAVSDDEDTPLLTPDPRGTAGRADDSVGEPDTDALSGAANAVKSFVMSVPQYLSFLKGREGQYDNVMDKGINEALNAQVSTTDPTATVGGGMGPQQAPAPAAPVEQSQDQDVSAQQASPDASAYQPTTPLRGPVDPNQKAFTQTPGGGVTAGQPAPTAQGSGTAPQDLNSFVGNFNKQNKTNYSVGAQTPKAPVPGGPAVYAGTTPQSQLMGARATQPQPQGEKPFVNPDALPPELVRQANALYPNVGDQDKRSQFIIDNMKARAEQASKLEVAQNTHYYGNLATAAAHLGGAQSAADARVQSSQINSGARVNVAQIKAQADIAAAKSRDPITQAKYRSLSSWMTANPGARSDAIQKQMQILGINPQAVGMQSQAPAPVQQAPAQGGPPDWAVQKLMQNPDKAADFDAKFGPGAAQKVLAGQT